MTDCTVRVGRRARTGKRPAQPSALRFLEYTDEKSFAAARLRWMNVVNRDESLSWCGLRVAGLISEFARFDSPLLLTAERVADELQIGERSARQAFADLRAAGWIVARRRGRGLANAYNLSENPHRVAVIEGQKKIAADRAEARREARLSIPDDRHSFAGQSGRILPVKTGTISPIKTGTILPPIPVSIHLDQDTCSVNPEPEGQPKKEGRQMSCTVLEPDPDEVFNAA